MKPKEDEIVIINDLYIGEFNRNKIIVDESLDEKPEIPDEIKPEIRSAAGPSTIIKDALDIARKEVGVREYKLTNTGKKVEEYQATTTLGGTGWPWCAAYTSWVLKQAFSKHDMNYKNYWLNSASCDFILYWARDNKVLYNSPQSGDAFLVMANENDATHIGFVKEVFESKFSTYEGNTNDNGSANGDGVYSLTRPRTSRYRYVRWANLVPKIEEFPKEDVQLWDVYLNDKFISKAEIKEGTAWMKVEDWTKAMGFDLSWDATSKKVKINDRLITPKIKDKEVATWLRDGKAWYPVRNLVENSALDLKIEGSKITIFRPQSITTMLNL